MLAHRVGKWLQLGLVRARLQGDGQERPGRSMAEGEMDEKDCFGSSLSLARISFQAFPKAFFS